MPLKKEKEGMNYDPPSIVMTSSAQAQIEKLGGPAKKKKEKTYQNPKSVALTRLNEKISDTD